MDRVTSYTVEPLYSGHCVGRPPAYSSQWIGSQAIQWNFPHIWVFVDLFTVVSLHIFVVVSQGLAKRIQRQESGGRDLDADEEV